jgi:hypothetical protein
LVIDFVNLNIKSCVRVFIGVDAHTCINIYIYTVFLTHRSGETRNHPTKEPAAELGATWNREAVGRRTQAERCRTS